MKPRKDWEQEMWMIFDSKGQPDKLRGVNYNAKLYKITKKGEELIMKFKKAKED